MTTTEFTAVATRLAAVLDLIEEHRRAGAPISARRVAAISAMIDDVAATAAEGAPRAGRRLRRMGSAANWYVEAGALIGEGSFGAVARARHRATGEALAVKSLYADGAGAGDPVANLLREACFAAACRGHPSLVALHGVARRPAAGPGGGGASGGYSLVMERVGPNLVDVLDSRGGAPFREADARRVMRRLLSAAEEMHRRGVVHRDIKLENVLLGAPAADGWWTVKLCDFGSAKCLAERRPPYHIAGTSHYMAPEMLVMNVDHGAAVDAWSLGCVMAELLTGKLLFHGSDTREQLRSVFDVLGVPGEREWRAMKPRVYFADEVPEWREEQRKAGHRCRLRELVPADVLSEEGFHVLKGLLTCDPEQRLTAAATLRCAWFTDNAADDDAPV